MSIILGCIVGALRVERLFLQWVCLEVNILCIIPVLLGRSTQDSIMCGVKYFISQRAASVSFLFSILLIDSISLLSMVAMASIIFKLGIPPFHRWIIGIIFNINLLEVFLVLTVQKFIPLMILSQLGINEINLLVLIGIGGSFIVVNVNSNLSLQFILFLSSVGNGMWILAGLIGQVWGIFLIMYSLILLGAVSRLLTRKCLKFRDIATGDNRKKIEIALQFFNLGGVPPLIGFAVKLIVLKNLAFLRVVRLLRLIIISVIILYIYISMMYQVYTVNPASYQYESGSRSTKILRINTSLILSFRIVSWLLL